MGEPCLSEPAFWLRDDREDELARLRREQPVAWQDEPVTDWSQGGRGYWAVLGHAGVRSASRDAETFLSGLGTELFELPVEVAQLYSGMLNMDAPRHTRLRAIVSAAFSPRYVNLLENAVQRRAAAVVDAVCERGTCDFASAIADRFPLAVICDMLGVPEQDRLELARLSRVSVPLGDAEFGTFDDAFQAALDLIDYAKDLQRVRRDHPADDLTTLLMQADVDGERLTADEAGSFFELLITAGIETTSASVAHGMIALCRNPGQRERWQREGTSVAPSAVEEVLRWSTPVIHFRRTAAVDTELAGKPIAAGDKVVLFYHSANRDEAVFDHPYRFDVGRNPNPHLAFSGGGPHFCLGAHLARLEIRVMFHELFTRLPDLELAAEPEVMHSMFFNGVKSMPVAFTPGPRAAGR
ncbi:MAG: methyl-branched lipid omega-hydroxylase [Gaiellales bacterium]|jgi:cytochrome P450|nr:methyl-branched lipid omega-hydroxylase [Gaiellales bacterium]